MTQYEAITPDILDELKAISGHRVIVGEEINPDYTHDDMPIYGLAMPEVTIDVTSTEEVSAIMKSVPAIISPSRSAARERAS